MHFEILLRRQNAIAFDITVIEAVEVYYGSTKKEKCIANV